MANMSYCRFRNTATDLRDCLNALDPDENDDEISAEEERAGTVMIEHFLSWCMDEGIIDEFDREAVAAVFERHREAIESNNDEEDE